MEIESIDEEKRSGWKFFFGLIFFFLVLVLLVVYWFIPYNEFEFSLEGLTENANYNFSSSGNFDGGQFYENMRFPSNEISYKIYGCSLIKKNRMEQAFDIMENVTVLDFNSVLDNEEISIYCDEKRKFDEGMFIAGEGGPTNITKTENFNVILNGKILLLKESDCKFPNVAIHELLHVLGFEHSTNKNNIMYNFTSCKQTLGDDITAYIDELYSVPSYPDLAINDASALMRGKYLDLNLSVMNWGLTDAGKSKIVVYADDKKVKDWDLDGIVLGYGTIISLENIWISQLNVNEIKVVVENSFEELSKENNVVILKVED